MNRSDVRPAAHPDARRRENLIAAAIIAGHLCITVPLGLWLNVWIDEYYSLATTSKGLMYAVDHCITFQGHPPFFYILLWAWRQIDPSIPFGRMLPVGIIAATLWIVHLTARRWFPNLPTAWVLLPLAINPWILYAAMEIRLYCLIPFWGAVLLYLFHAGFVSAERSLSAQVNFAIAATLGIYSFYYVGFLLPGGALALLVWREWRALRNYVLLMCGTGVLILPQFLMSIQDTELYTAGVERLPSATRSVVFTSGRIVESISGIFEYPETPRAVIFFFIAGAFLIGMLAKPTQWDLRSSAIPFLCSTVVLGYLALTKFIMGEIDFIRHFIGATIPLHMTAVALADRFGPRRRAVLAGAMAALLVLCAGASVLRFRPLAKIGDYRRVAAYLETNEKPNEPIVVAVSHAEYPLRVYYDGVNPLVPLPHHDDLTTYEVDKWTIHDPQEVRDALAQVAPGDRIWVFTDRPPYAEWSNHVLNLQMLEDVLNEGYEMESESDFYKAKVRKFRKR